MSAPLFLTAAGALDGVRPGDVVRLDGAEGRHAATVKRLQAGEPVQLADGAGALVRGEVAAADRDGLAVRAHAVEVVPDPQPRFVLVQALVKGGRDELAVQACTELGVDAVVPWAAQRCVVQWRGERGEKARRGWADVAREAAKQARRSRVPQIGELVDQRGLAALAGAAAATLVLHEEATAPIGGIELPDQGDVLLVVGPEGGISDAEVQAFVDAGAIAVRLGPTVLRSSTAGAAALAVLNVRAGRW